MKSYLEGLMETVKTGILCAQKLNFCTLNPSKLLSSSGDGSHSFIHDREVMISTYIPKNSVVDLVRIYDNEKCQWQLHGFAYGFVCNFAT
jgi:hypothetical protein